jgi:hypothetical protein
LLILLLPPLSDLFTGANFYPSPQINAFSWHRSMAQASIAGIRGLCP